jgi:hypothetical protein
MGFEIVGKIVLIDTLSPAKATARRGRPDLHEIEHLL